MSNIIHIQSDSLSTFYFMNYCLYSYVRLLNLNQLIQYEFQHNNSSSDNYLQQIKQTQTS